MKSSRLIPAVLALQGLFFLVAPSARAEGIDPKLKAAFAVAKTERVAVIALGDSNQRFGGHGWSHYMSRALGNAYGCYGTDFTIYRQSREKDGPPRPVPPAELADRAFGYWYVEPGQTATVSWNNGRLIIPADHPLGVSGKLRFHFRYGTFADTKTPGTFQPVVHRHQAPATVLASAPAPINPATGACALERLTLDLPADPSRSWPLQFGPVAADRELAGPFLASLAHAENPDRKTGIAYRTLYAVNGGSLSDMVKYLRSLKTGRTDEFFGETLRLLGASGRKSRTGIVMISSGINDRARRTPSLGLSPAISSTPEGYADNLRALVAELETIWVRNGGDAGALHFSFLVSHTLGDPENEKLAAYREAARALAASLPHASMVDLSDLVPHAKMKAGRYYDKDRATDAHLSKAGYEAISRELAARLTQ